MSDRPEKSACLFSLSADKAPCGFLRCVLASVLLVSWLILHPHWRWPIRIACLALALSNAGKPDPVGGGDVYRNGIVQ
jgi:hypothetical protein